jgi:hypothetical protein
VRTTYAHRSLARRSRSFLVNPSRRPDPRRGFFRLDDVGQHPIHPGRSFHHRACRVPRDPAVLRQEHPFQGSHQTLVLNETGGRGARHSRLHSRRLPAAPSSAVTPHHDSPFVVASGARPAIQHNPGSND